MSDIDFLANDKKQDDDQERKKPDEKKEKIVWSEPKPDNSTAKEAPFHWLSSLNKSREVKRPVAGPEPVQEPKLAVDKKRIRESRREILKLIKRDENSGLKKKNQARRNLFSGLIERLKKQLSRKEILIDYQKVFNQEKIKRNPPAYLFARPPARPAGQANHRPDKTPKIKPAAAARQWPALSAGPFRADLGELSRTELGIKTELAKKERPAKIVKESWFSGLFSPFRRWFLDLAALRARQIKTKQGAAGRPAKEEQAFKAAAEKGLAIIKPPQPAEISARQAKARQDDFFSKLFKLIKNFISARNKVKKNSASAKSAELLKTMVPAAPKPTKENLAETAAKEKGLEQAGAPLTEERSPKVLETNLIKGEIVTFFDWRKKIIITLNAVLIPVLVIAAIYFGLVYYQKQSQAKIQDQAHQFADLMAEIRQAEVGLKEAIDFQARLKIVSQIFAEHIYWTNFFKFLEDNTIKAVYYAGFSGDTGGNYSLDAIGSKFGDIFEQVKVLRNNDRITDVRTVGGEAISDSAADQAGIKFNLNFSILKSIFTE